MRDFDLLSMPSQRLATFYSDPSARSKCARAFIGEAFQSPFRAWSRSSLDFAGVLRRDSVAKSADWRFGDDRRTAKMRSHVAKPVDAQ